MATATLMESLKSVAGSLAAPGRANRNTKGESTMKICRWSDAKLDKELAFARAAKDEAHPENLKWLEQLEAEANRRDEDIDSDRPTLQPVRESDQRDLRARRRSRMLARLAK